jgi:hypothetical protein
MPSKNILIYPNNVVIHMCNISKWVAQRTTHIRQEIGFKVLTTASIKMAVFWVVADYMVLQPRR